MKEGDKFLAELNLKMSAEAQDRLEREIRDLLLWRLLEYDYYLDSVLDTTEN